MDLQNLQDDVTALEVFSPEKILQMLESKQDCTEELLGIVRDTRPVELKKLTKIFLKLDNFDIEKIIEITSSKIRMHRFNSTYLIFTLMKNNYRNMKK